MHRIDLPKSSPEAWYFWAHRTVHFRHACRLLNEFLLQQLSPELRARFRFTTITLNQDFCCPRHRDRNNAGPSAICAAGPFPGGALRYWDRDGRSGPDSRLDPADAVDLRLRQKVWLCDGTKAHEVTPFDGQRTSVV